MFRGDSGSMHIDIVQEVASECEKLGILLGLSRALVTNTMSSKAHGSLEDKCRNIIEKWLLGQGRSFVSWRTFLSVLEDMSYLELRDTIYAELTQFSR